MIDYVLSFIILLVILFFVAVFFITYIFMAIGLFNIARKEGRRNLVWLAWIPIIQQFLILLLVEGSVHNKN